MFVCWLLAGSLCGGHVRGSLIGTEHDVSNPMGWNSRASRALSDPTMVNVVSHVGPWTLKNEYKELPTYAELAKDDKADLTSSFTVCSTLLTPALIDAKPQTLFTLVGDDYTEWATFQMYSTKEADRKSHFYLIFSDLAMTSTHTLDMVFPYQWARSCFAFTLDSGLVQWVVNGQLIEDIVVPKLKVLAPNRPKDLTGRLLLGAFKHPAGWQLASNKITNLNVYSSALSISKMKSLTTAGSSSCGEEGDYLRWADTTWNLYGNAKIEQVPVDEPCKPLPHINVYMAWFQFYPCMQHCEKLKARAPRVTTVEEWNKANSFLEPAWAQTGPHRLEGLWLSITDVEVDGVWRDYYTGDLMTHPGPFTGTGPNGGSKENCAKQINGKNWIDWYCTDPDSPCPCEHQQRPFLQLRGLCHKSNIHRLYLPMNDKDDISEIYMISNQDTRIQYDVNNWLLTQTGTDTVATSDSPRFTYVLGKHEWTITNDSYVCSKGKPYTTQLKLSGCVEGEFTCSDGQCIKMVERCDQVVQCRDASDEEHCQVLALESSYNKKVPPITTVSATDFTVVPVPVNISIILMKIVGVHEVEHTIVLQFEIVLNWMENRAMYQNLKQDTSLNALSDLDIWSLWIPYVVYDNTDMKEAVQLMDGLETTMTVTREGPYTSSGLDILDEVDIFRGDENRITMNQTYSKKFQCEYKLAYYPFDTQKCSMDMNVRALDMRTVQLNPNMIVMKEKMMLTMYEITEWGLDYTIPGDTTSGVKMEITLKRRIANEMMTTYLPTILLISIAFATVYFKEFYFEAALTVNLTNMLVLTTIFTAVMEKLPATAYIKHVDIWLIGAQMLPFLYVIILTAKEYLREDDESMTHHPQTIVRPIDDDEEKKIRTVNHHGKKRQIDVTEDDNQQITSAMRTISIIIKIERLVLPLAFLAFVLIYVMAAISMYYEN